jgi:hypothetical protein
MYLPLVDFLLLLVAWDCLSDLIVEFGLDVVNISAWQSE